MSQKHYVNCTINNQTTEEITYTSKNLSHGEFYSGPSSVLAGQVIQTFSAGSKSGFYGITGWAKYTLSDGASLYLMFNNPYTHYGTGYTGNQWFYACVDSFSKYSAVVDSSSFLDPVKPMSSNTISPIVTIYLSEDLVKGNISTPSFSAPTGNYVYISILNNTGQPLSLSSLTNGYNSPPVSNGNPPFIAETIPTMDDPTPILAIFGDGGIYSEQPTSGTATYNLPDGSDITIYWMSTNDNQVNVNLGGSSPTSGTVQVDSSDSTNITVIIDS